MTQFEVLPQHLTAGTEENHEETPIKIIDVSTEIRIGHPTNI
jgi:hypothetical protein